MVFMLGMALIVSVIAYAGTDGPGLDQNGIARALGKKGDVLGDTYKVSYPRSDLRVRVGKMAIKPALALVSWAAFKKSGDSAVSYGDLVLLENEINPVVSKLEEKGIEISALHNHLLYESPRIMYIHFIGYGNEVEMAKGLREALALTKTPLKTKPASNESKPAVAKKIEEIFGYEGSMSGGVFHVTVPRNDLQVKMMGASIPGNMGMNTLLNFQIEGKKAAISGDFMLLSDEVNPVIKALRSNGIEAASLHNHMLNEDPRLFFLHFWGYGDAVTLAKGLKVALDTTNIKK